MKKRSFAIWALAIIFLVPSLCLLLEKLGIFSAFSLLLSLASPLFIGICIAFVINIPMSLIEPLILKLTKATRTYAHKLIRMLSILLSATLVFGIFVGVFVFIIPEAKRAVMQLIDNIPSYMESNWQVFVSLLYMVQDNVQI